MSAIRITLAALTLNLLGACTVDGTNVQQTNAQTHLRFCETGVELTVRRFVGTIGRYWLHVGAYGRGDGYCRGLLKSTAQSPFVLLTTLTPDHSGMQVPVTSTEIIDHLVPLILPLRDAVNANGTVSRVTSIDREYSVAISDRAVQVVETTAEVTRIDDSTVSRKITFFAFEEMLGPVQFAGMIFSYSEDAALVDDGLQKLIQTMRITLTD